MGDELATGELRDLYDDIETECVEDSSVDALFLWTASESGCYSMDTTGSSFNTSLSLHDTCDLEMITCDDDSGGYGRSKLAQYIDAGESFVIAIDAPEDDDRGGRSTSSTSATPTAAS